LTKTPIPFKLVITMSASGRRRPGGPLVPCTPHHSCPWSVEAHVVQGIEDLRLAPGAEHHGIGHHRGIILALNAYLSRSLICELQLRKSSFADEFLGDDVDSELLARSIWSRA
jgi:hypothetical protein